MYRKLKLRKRISILNIGIGNYGNGQTDRQTDFKKNTAVEWLDFPFSITLITMNYKI